jgi:hypothetical protein
VVEEPYIEPSFTEMLALFTNDPLLQDFKIFSNPYVLPISLEEYWQNYLSNEADYFYDKTVAAKGE